MNGSSASVPDGADERATSLKSRAKLDKKAKPEKPGIESLSNLGEEKIKDSINCAFKRLNEAKVSSGDLQKFYLEFRALFESLSLGTKYTLDQADGHSQNINNFVDSILSSKASEDKIYPTAKISSDGFGFLSQGKISPKESTDIVNKATHLTQEVSGALAVVAERVTQRALGHYKSQSYNSIDIVEDWSSKAWELMKDAWDRFDPTRGAKRVTFLTFVATTELRRQFSIAQTARGLTGLPNKVQQLVKRINTVDFGQFDPNQDAVRQLTDYLNRKQPESKVTEPEVKQALEARHHIQTDSLEKPINDRKDRTFGQTIIDPRADISEQIIESEIRKVSNNIKQTINDNLRAMYPDTNSYQRRILEFQIDNEFNDRLPEEFGLTTRGDRKTLSGASLIKELNLKVKSDTVRRFLNEIDKIYKSVINGIKDTIKLAQEAGLADMDVVNLVVNWVNNKYIGIDRATAIGNILALEEEYYLDDIYKRKHRERRYKTPVSYQLAPKRSIKYTYEPTAFEYKEIFYDLWLSKQYLDLTENEANSLINSIIVDDRFYIGNLKSFIDKSYRDLQNFADCIEQTSRLIQNNKSDLMVYALAVINNKFTEYEYMANLQDIIKLNNNIVNDYENLGYPVQSTLRQWHVSKITQLLTAWQVTAEIQGYRFNNNKFSVISFKSALNRVFDRTRPRDSPLSLADESRQKQIFQTVADKVFSDIASLLSGWRFSVTPARLRNLCHIRAAPKTTAALGALNHFSKTITIYYDQDSIEFYENIQLDILFQEFGNWVRLILTDLEALELPGALSVLERLESCYPVLLSGPKKLKPSKRQDNRLLKAAFSGLKGLFS